MHNVENLVVRCHGCESTLIYKWTGDREIEVFHDCPRRIVRPETPQTGGSPLAGGTDCV